MSLEDIGELFGDEIVLQDENIEVIHKRFKESHYNEQVVANLIDSEKGATVVEDEGDGSATRERR